MSNKEFFKNNSVLVTGACGTIDKELVRQLLTEYKVRELMTIDNNESELLFLEQSHIIKPWPNSN